MRRRSAAPSVDEAFAILRATLAVALEKREQASIMVSSPAAGDGRTFTCAHLARAFASSGGRVAVVDLDLRHPDLHRHLGLAEDVGAVDVLAGRRTVADALRAVEIDGTEVLALTAGPAEDRPAELLGADAPVKLLDQLSDHADIVVVDTPPLLATADGLVVGQAVTAAVVVVRNRRTPVPEAARAVAQLRRNQTPVLGVVLNDIRSRDAGDLLDLVEQPDDQGPGP